MAVPVIFYYYIKCINFIVYDIKLLCSFNFDNLLRYEDLSKKCEHMLMENEDAAHNIRQLTRDVQDKDQEINFLNTELTRYIGNCIYLLFED